MPKFHENFLLSRLKLRQLRLLTAIADEGTVLKGSQALNIAQPAATKSIKELEDALEEFYNDADPADKSGS